MGIQCIGKLIIAVERVNVEPILLNYESYNIPYTHTTFNHNIRYNLHTATDTQLLDLLRNECSHIQHILYDALIH